MQVNKIGNDHKSNLHRVTNCVHDHGEARKKSGMSASVAASKAQSGETAARDMTAGQFSPVAWIQNVLGGIGRLLGSIWGGGNPQEQTAAAKEQGTVNGDLRRTGSQETQQHNTVGAAQVFGPGLNEGMLQKNPYFAAVQDTESGQENLWQKMKVRFYTIAGQHNKNFSGKNSFQAKQERQKEDLRRHSRYRQDDLEVDCVITDDSYLLDSYDKNGEYSRLSAKK